MITIEGGIIWPSVPEAEITPVANSGEYLFLSIVGNDNKPIVTTVAPTIPVDAAKNAPTTTTETAKPPGKWPNTLAIVVNNSPAIFYETMLSKFALSQGVSEDKVDDWKKQLNKSEKVGNFGFTSFPVLTAAYLG